jgi:alpha 1,3-glucosidase
MFPKDTKGFTVDDQYFIGSSGILVKPITTKGATETTVYLPEDEVRFIAFECRGLLTKLIQVYYDYFSHHVSRGAAKGKDITVQAALHEVPVFVRGGSIVPTRERPRRSSPLMKLDPFTLRVALSKAGNARGELYLDDGVSYSHEKGQFVWREFSAATAKKTVRLTTKNLGVEKKDQAVDGVALTSYDQSNAYAKTIADVRVEKIVVEGLTGKPTSVKVEGGKELVWEYTPGIAAGGKGEGVASVLTIKDPKVLVVKDWAVVIQL